MPPSPVSHTPSRPCRSSTANSAAPPRVAAASGFPSSVTQHSDRAPTSARPRLGDDWEVRGALGHREKKVFAAELFYNLQRMLSLGLPPGLKWKPESSRPAPPLAGLCLTLSSSRTCKAKMPSPRKPSQSLNRPPASATPSRPPRLLAFLISARAKPEGGFD